MPAPQTTVLQLLFVSATKFNFAHVVHDLQDLLGDLGHAPAQVTWDLDEVVTLRTDKIVAVVGWGDGLPMLAAQHLTFSLAPLRPSPVSRAQTVQLERLDGALANWMTRRFRPDRVIRAQSDLPPHADLLDILAQTMMASTLADQTAERLHGFRAAVSEAEVRDCMGRMPRFPDQLQPKGPHKPPSSIRPHPAIFAARQARPAPPMDGSLALRMATQLFNLTLAVVWLPLGVVLLAHACLHGSDLRRSAQAMVLAGLFSAAIRLQVLSNLPNIPGI